MSSIAHLSNNWITICLSLFGVAGLLGSYLFSKFYAKNRVNFLRIMTLNIAIALVLLEAASFSLITLILICCYWGLTSTGFNVACQSEVILHAGNTGTVAMSIFSGIFNLGIGMGSFIGGQAVNLLGIGSIGFVGAFIGLIASIYCFNSCK